MKTFKNIISFFALIFAVGLSLNFSACTEGSPLQTEVKASDQTLAKGIIIPVGNSDNGEEQNQGGNNGPTSTAKDELLEQNSRWGVASE